MNGPFLVAQLPGSTPQTSSALARNIKLEKPQNGAAVTVHLDGQTQLDFTDVASEKLTFVRVGDKLVVLFDNQSTVTVEPVFGPDGHPLADVAFEMAPDRTLTGDQFASLFPITTDQSVLPAAGNGGPTAGANFSDAHVDALSTGTALGLLTGENLGSTSSAFALAAGNPPPVAGPIPTVTVNEDALPGGNPGAPGVITITGSLNIDFGTETNGRNFSFAATQAGLSGLSSDGQAVHLFVTTVGGLPTMIGYVGTDPSIVANEVFTVSLNANSTLDGTFTFTLLRPLDHPIIGTEDTLNLSIDVIATDGTGAVTPAVINVNVVDNAPIVIASEETHSTITDPVTGVVATTTGSLGISWGADNFNDHVDGGVSATTGKDGDRAVVFTDAVVTATGDVAGVASSIGSLTSNGIALQYVLLNNGTELVAYTGGTAPTAFPTDAATAASEHVVLTVSLSDASNSGSYVISQYQPLDHNSGATLFDSIDLNFHFTATDSDSDPVSGTLTATIDDTVPTVTESLVTHSTITDPLIPSQATATGTLGIIWGADSANATTDGGVTAADGDRAVIFGNATVTATGSAGGVVTGITGLTSEHQTVNYVLLDNGTVLVAYTGATAPTTVPAPVGLPEGLHLDAVQPASNIVFVVTLTDDSATGGYTVTQYQPLDHIADGTKFDSIDLTFNFTAVDSDGDPATGTLTVTIDDTAPLAAAVLLDQTVSEQALPDGNHVQSETLIATNSLGINWGADNEIVTAVGGFGRTLSFLAGDDSTVIPGGSATVSSLALSILGEQGAALSSGGVPLVYTVTANANGGETLTAFQGTTSGAVVFTLSLDPTASNGNYTFTLDGALDHGANSNSMSLAFTVQATDADGDAVQQYFTIDVQDDVPVLNGTLVAAASVFEDGLKGGNGSDTTFAGTAAVPEALNINWGADDALHSAADATGRTLSFLAGDNSVITGGAVSSLAMSITGSEQSGALSSGGVALVYTVTANDNGGETLTAFKGIGGAEIFTLTLDPTQAHGGYVFNLLGPLDDASNSNTIGLTFTVQAADADGDATTTQFTVNVQDDVPVVSATAVAAVSVFEGGLSGGNGISPDLTSITEALNINWGADNDTRGNGGSSDTFGRTLSFLAGDSTVISGGSSLVSSLAMSITGEQGHALSSGGVALVYTVTANADGGETLTAFKGSIKGAEIFTLTLDPTQDHGGYSFDLMGPLDDASGSNTIGLTFTVQGADADGDTVNTQFLVNVQDDTPIAGIGTPEAVKEANLLDGSSPDLHDLSVTGSLNVAWGADANNSGNTDNRSVGFQHDTQHATASADVQVTDSSNDPVTLTSNGHTVQYGIFNGVLVGYVNNDPVFEQVFTVSLNDNGSGSYTFTLLNNLDHPAGGGNNNLNLTFDFTATDSDGDSSPSTFTVTVVDDVPTAHVGDVGFVNEANLPNGTAPLLFGLVSPSTSGDLNIVWGADNNNSGSTNNRSVSFENIASNSNASLDVHVTTGTPGNTTDVTGLTSDGVPIQYAFVHGALVGYTDSVSHPVFTVTLDDNGSGSYTFTLLGNLDHPTGQGTNLLNFTFDYTATDSDGDASNSQFTVTVKDSVPLAFGGDTAVVNENDLPSGTSPHASALSDSESLNIAWGADDNNTGTTNNRSVAFSNTNVGVSDGFHSLSSLTSDGEPVHTTMIGSVLVGYIGAVPTSTTGTGVVFNVSLSDSGDGSYTFTLLGNLDHPTDNGQNTLELTFNYTATDSDGDTASNNFTVDVKDDVPVVTGSISTHDVGEDGLTGANATGGSFNAVDNLSTGAVSLNVNWGADNAISSAQDSTGRSLTFNVSTSHSGVITPLDSHGHALNLTSDGVALQYVVTTQANGTQELDAYKGSLHTAANLVFSVVLDPTAAHGTYNFTLSGNLDHPASGSQDDNLQLNFGITATDSDGDSVAQNFTVDVQDDVPVAQVGAAETVSEASLPHGTSPNSAALAATGSLNIEWGADNGNATSHGGAGDRSVAFTNATVAVTGINGNAVTGLTSDGQTIHYAVLSTGINAGVLVAYTGGTPSSATASNVVFNVALSDGSNGGYAFTLLQTLDDPSSPTNLNALKFTFNYTATDSDGDTSSSHFTTMVTDDTPVGPTGASMTIAEHGLVTTPSGISLTSTGPVAFAPGADGFLNGSLASAVHFTTLPTGLTIDNGTAITVTQNGATVTGMAGTTEVFTLTVNANGTYTYDQFVALHHPNAGADNDALNFGFTIADGDGDVSSAATVTVNVTDDTPTTPTGASMTIAEHGLVTTPSGISLTSTGPVAFAPGADGFLNGSLASAVHFTTLPTGLTIDNGTAITVTQNGATVTGMAGTTEVFTLTVNANGTYTYDQFVALHHPNAGADNDALNFGFTITDGDGDVSSAATITVNVTDDVPTVGTPAATEVFEHTLVAQPAAPDSVSGSLGVSFGADGPGVIPAFPGTPQTFNFNGLANVALNSSNDTFGTFVFTANQGGSNHTLEGTSITMTNNAGPFTLTSIDLGLAGTSSGSSFDNVTLIGLDSHGNQIASLNVNLGSLLALPGDPLTFTFNAAGTVFAGLQISTLEVQPAEHTLNLNASAFIDNVVVATGAVPAAPAPVAFTDLAAAINNISIADQSGNVVSASTLTSHGQQVQYELLDTATLVAYTGSAPTSITAANVVFSVVLSQDPVNHPNGSYTFTLDKPLDDLPAAVTDLNFTFKFTATDGDGDTTPGKFTVDVHDDVPTLVAQTPVGIVDGNFLGTTGDFTTPGSWSAPLGAIDSQGSIEGWSYTASPVGGATQVQLERVDSGYAGSVSPDGSPMVDLEASPGNIQVTQTITGLANGEHLLVSFDIGEANFGNAKLEVLWDGQNVGIYNPQNGPMQLESIGVTGNGTGNDTLTFQEIGISGDNTGTFLTDVSATQVAGTVYEAGLNDSVSISTTISLPDGSPFVETSSHQVVGTEAGAANPPPTTASGTLAGLVQFGADGPAMNGSAANGFELVNAAAATSFVQGLGLSSLGSSVNQATLLGDTLTATAADGHKVFTLTVNGDGTWSFNLLAPLVDSHQGADSITLDFSSLVKAVDFDGDSIGLTPGTFSVAVVDDVPIDTGTPVTGVVSESGLATAVSQAFNPLDISYGADGEQGHLTFASNTISGLSTLGLTSNGVGLSYVLQTLSSGEEQIVAFRSDETATTPVFVVALNSPVNPEYVFTLSQPLDHNGTLPLTFTVNATDGDGDTVQQSFTVNVQDSVPTVGTSTVGDVSEDGPLTLTNAPLNINFGTDNGTFPGSHLGVTFTDGVVIATDPHGAAVPLTSDGNAVLIGFIGTELVGYTGAMPTSATDSHIVFTATLSTSGTYDFTLNHPLDNAAPVGTNDSINLTFDITATDADGSQAAGHFTVNVDAAGSIGSIDYNTETSGVFVNLSDSSVTEGSQVLAAHSASDLASGGGHVIGIDALGSITDATGGSGNDVLVAGSSAGTLDGGAGNDLLVAGGASDKLIGGSGVDTAQYTASTLTTASFSYDQTTQSWVVTTTGQGTDHLQGVEVVTDGTHRFLLVGGGSEYTTIQQAINAAQAGDTILIAPGTYTESAVPTGFSTTAGGLFINTPNLTLQGYSSLDGTVITSAAQAEAYGPTVISGAETDFGSNHFIGTNGSGTTIEGLHLAAGPDTGNKLLEITANNVTIENDFIDTFVGGKDTGAAAIYLDGQGAAITGYLIDHNILNEGIYVASGVGTAGTISTTQIISNNEFLGSYDPATDGGRYDMVAVQGNIPGDEIGAAQIPTIDGNTRNDNSAPFIFRMTESNAALFPTASQLATIIADNTDVNTSYAYVLNADGTPHLIDRNIGSGPFEELTVANGIGTLDAGFEPGNLIFGDLRNTMASGDTVIVQSVGHTVSDIVVDNLTIQATASSADLNLTLDNTGAFTVKTVTLADYATGLGANVNVTGNDQGDTITGNSGNNDLTGGAGNDTFIYTVGGGDDVVDGRGGTDTQIVNGIATAETFNISPIDASHLGINIVAGTNVAAMATTANAEISDTNVEEIVVNLGSAGDTVIVSGDLSGTGVASSTITINGGAGDDTVNLFSFKSNEDVVFNGAGNGAGGDTVILGFALHDAVAAPSYVPVLDSNGHLIGAEITYTSADGVVTDTFTNVEHFEFTDGTLSIGQIFPPTGVATASVADTAAANVNTVVASGDALSTITDVDAGTTLLVTAVNNSAGNVGADVAGTYGTLHLDLNGSYTYTANAALDALIPGQNPTDVFHFTVADSNGGVSTTTLTFNITGAADTPVVGNVDAGTVADTSGVDAGKMLAQGNLLTGDSDRDSGVTLTVTTLGGVAITAGGTDVPDDYGTLHVNPDGSYTFTAGAGLDALGAGQSVSFLNTFTVTSSDGAVAPQRDVEFLFTGANDPAQIGLPTVSSVTEDVNVVSGNLTATGTIPITDRDTGENHFNTTVTPGSGDLGSLVLQSNGSYVYTVADSAVQFLAGSNAHGGTSTHVDTFTVTAADGTSQLVSFTINGANDAAVSGTPTVSSVTEDVNVVSGNLTATGSISITDVDTGENHFNTTVTPTSGDLGSLVLQSNGSYVYTVADSAVQFLAGSNANGGTSTHVDTFTVTAADGTSQLVSFTINGANDAAVIGTPTVSSVTEDVNVVSGNLTATGSISITDVDTGENHFNTTVTPGSGDLGNLVLQSNGSYIYTVADSAVQFLSGGTVDGGIASHVDTFTVASADGTSQLVSFTINGVDDAPVNSVPGAQTVSENNSLVLSTANAISVFDVDNTILTETLTVLHGTLTLETETGLTFTTGNGIADATMTFSGSQSAINAALNGLTYTPGSNYVGSDTLQITSNDGQLSPSSSVAINVQLVDHAPVAVNDTYTGSTTSGTPSGTGWTLDSANGHYYEVVGGNVSWAQANAAAIAAGGYLATITSAAENAFILNLNGLTAQSQNLWLGGSDAATEGTWKWVTGPEAGTTFFNGDPSGLDQFQGSAVPGQYTNFGVGEPNNGVGWDSGENYLEMLTPFGNGIWNDGTGLAATDGSQADFVGYVMEYGGQVVVPTENAPVVIAVSALLANDSDPDTASGDTFSITSVQNAVHGTVSLSTDHQTVTFTPDANYFGAATFTYTITDSHGLTSTATVSLNVAEVNYPPLAVADAVSVNEDATAAAATRGAGVLANDTDQNSSDQATFAVSAVLAGTSGTASGVSGSNATVVQGIYGALTMHADGTYSYTPNDAAAEALGQGVTANDVFTYTMQDASGQTSNTTLTFHITGQDDAPVNGVPVAQSVAGNTSLVLSSTNGDAISVSDVDNSSLKVTLSVADGTLTLHQETGLTFTTGDGTTDASMTFTGSVTDINNALNGLTYTPTSNYVGSDTITIVGNDGILSDTDTVGITVQPVVTNHAPVFHAGTLAGSVTEDATPGLGGGNAIANGGFDIGSTGTGWTATSNGSFSFTGDGFVNSGNHDFIAGASGGATTAQTTTLSQTVTTIAGATYDLDFFMASGSFLKSSDHVVVSWDGTPITTINDIVGGSGYNEYSFNVVGTGSDTLTFTFVTLGFTFDLDTVSLTTTAVLPGVEKTSGQVTFTDADVTDTHTVTVTLAAGGYLGNFTTTVSPDSTGNVTGDVNWSFSVNDSAIQFLAAGQTLNQTYAVAVSDGHGGVISENVVVTINGTNDAPVLSSTAIVALNSEAAGGTNLVTNGGFEGSSSLNSWGTHTNVTDSASHPHSGADAAMVTALNTNSNATVTGALAQTLTGLTGLVVGQQYILDFWVGATNSSSNTASVVATVAASTVSATNLKSSGYTEETTVFTATSTSQLLSFSLTDSQKNQSVYLDDVSLTKGPVGAVGTLVSSLIGNGSGPNNVSDVDTNAKTGIAITGTTGLGGLGAGAWFYSINGGSTWSAFNAVSATNALLLDPNALVYFAPNNGTSTGTATLTFEAWDQTSGSSGGSGNASINGGSTAFSSTTETASVVVGTASTSPFPLTSGADNVFFVSGTNAVTGTLNGTNDSSGTLTTSDSLVGGSGVDTLTLTIGSSNSGTFNFGNMAKFIGFDDVAVAANPSQSASLTFTSANVLSGQTLTVDGSATTTASTHSFTVNAAGVNNGGNVVFIAGNFASNVFSGGSGNNTYEFANAYFTSSNHVTGGGNDTIQITTAANVADGAFTNDSAVEAILLGNFANTLVLDTHANTAFGGAGHVLTIDNSAATSGALSVTASNNVLENLVVITGGGADHLTGGAGNDTFEFTDAHFHGLGTAQFVAGGTGSDTIWITDSTAITVADADFGGVTGIETLKVGGTGADSIALGSTVNSEVGGANHTFTVDDSTGSGALTVNASGMLASLLAELNSADFTSADHITGGSGNDTIQLVDTAGMVVIDADFTNVSGIETLQLGGSGDISVTLGAFASADVGGVGHTLTVNDSAGTGNLTVDGSAMTANLNILGGSGTDHLIGGSGNDSITGGAGADTLTGGGGIDTFNYNNGDTAITVAGTGGSGTIAGYDVITDFAPGTDFLNLVGIPTVAGNTTVNGTDSTLTIGGATVRSDSISNGIITFSGSNTFASAISLTSTANVAAVVQYLENNSIGAAGTTVSFSATIAGVQHTYVYEQVGSSGSAANDILIDLVGSGAAIANLATLKTNGHLMPAGVSGEAINLALTDYSDHSGMVSLTVAGLAAGWALSEGTQNADGSWSVQTNDIGALSVTSPDGYVGALVLQVSENWTDSNGVAHTVYVSDNVEAFAKGSPVFAWSGDDTLTASGGNDTLVFANKIGADVVHNFDTAHDKIDLIGFNGISSFADVQAHLGHDASGNAVITLADGETITLDGVNAASLNAGDFEFNQTPVTANTGDMAISDGALLPLSGTVDNTGSIHLGSAGNETDLEIVQHGATLQGGGTLVMSDNSENAIFGSDPSVTLTNVDNIVSGAGQIGEGQMTLVNKGSIIADGTHALVIDTGVNTVINSGTLESTGAGGLTVQSDLANNGLLWANGGDLHLNGDVSGSGSALISGNANLEIGGAFNEQVQFDNGSAGTLTLDHSIDFKGILSGFGDHDSIDLGGILAATASLNYTENAAGTGGTLTVNDGSHTANIAFNGQYATSDFHVATDSGNHALIQIEQHAHQVAAAA
jgi:T1SS-143 domain-containing protein